MPAVGTLVETYLRARGISIPVPSALRFHPELKHSSGSTWPAMVGLVMRGSEALAIHRTFLSRDGKQSAGRAAEDDARSLPWRCGAAGAC